ncbi:MAG: NADH-quinone oxidoreductase subunit C [Thermoplasmata archaeon]
MTASGNQQAVSVQPKSVSVPATEMRPKVLKMARAEAQLVAITAVDLNDGSFELIYTFFTKSELVNLRLVVAEGQEVESISDIFPGALNFEREIVDLFGLRFAGVVGGLMVVPGSGIVNPLRKSSNPPTPASRAREKEAGPHG